MILEETFKLSLFLYVCPFHVLSESRIALLIQKDLFPCFINDQMDPVSLDIHSDTTHRIRAPSSFDAFEKLQEFFTHKNDVIAFKDHTGLFKRVTLDDMTTVKEVFILQERQWKEKMSQAWPSPNRWSSDGAFGLPELKMTSLSRDEREKVWYVLRNLGGVLNTKRLTDVRRKSENDNIVGALYDTCLTVDAELWVVHAFCVIFRSLKDPNPDEYLKKSDNINILRFISGRKDLIVFAAMFLGSPVELDVISYCFRNGISCLYHFTDKRNIESIRERGLLPWTEAIKIPGAILGSTKAERAAELAMGRAGMVKLHAVKNNVDGRIWLRIDLDVLCIPGVDISTSSGEVFVPCAVLPKFINEDDTGPRD
jgi:hypothetical protein